MVADGRICNGKYNNFKKDYGIEQSGVTLQNAGSADILIIMNSWVIRNKLMVIGAVAGALAGFIYWKYVGCLTGSCAITSNPVRSTLYFAVLGALLFSLFKKEDKAKSPGTDDIVSKTDLPQG